MRKFIRRIVRIFIVLTVLLIGLLLTFKIMVDIKPPYIADTTALGLKREKVSDSLLWCDDSWLRLNREGIWEMYISGSPFELGVKNGKLTKELAQKQEYEFVEFIKTVIPSESTLNYLKYFIAWFNKDLDEFMPLQLQKEIYGISLFASKDYDFIAPKYYRILNYHAAHDIGHTLQNMNLVACTAFSVKDSLTKDNSLLIGRNLDFSAGDGFAKEKIIAFCEPDTGYKFMYITWGGMVGVLSGMNEHGLTVTLNSAKSDLPASAKTPVSAVSRMILQYAKNIEEAFEIANSYETFVSECFFIGSAEDNNTAIIEKSIKQTVLYQSKSSKLVLTNHYLSDSLKNTQKNMESIDEGSTLYRYKRVNELLSKTDNLDHLKMAGILRNQKGLIDSDIGFGNEKAINQLICHHSIIFQPSKKIVWVSAYPYQLGKYLAYDLNKVFSKKYNKENIGSIDSFELAIKEDPFLFSDSFYNFSKYKEKSILLKKTIEGKISKKYSHKELEDFVRLNPEYYYTYYLVARYFYHVEQYSLAMEYYRHSLTKEFPRLVDKQKVMDEKNKAWEQFLKNEEK